MGYKKIENLLGIDTDDFTKPKYSTTKWIEIFDQSNGSYSVNKDIRFKASQLRNDLCDFNDAYIVVTGRTTATNPDPPDGVYYSRKLALKNSALFYGCILKINSQLIEDAQNVDAISRMYSILIAPKISEKPLDHFGSTIQTCQVQDMLVMMKEQECFIQSVVQKVLIIKQN